MLFNSYTFLVFFCAVTLVYYTLSNWNARKLFLLIASYLFYAAWNPPFVILILFSTIFGWWSARLIDRASQPRSKQLLLIISLIINFGLLGFFKYGNFILDNFTALVNTIGIGYHPAHLDIILPIGISFYTFETVSYVLDVYFGKSKASSSLLDYALYLTFFPHLVAGPILRADDFIKQCEHKQPFIFSNLCWGLSLTVLGLFEKVVIADGILAPIVESLYSAPGIPNFASAWGGTFAFTGQVFCDFAGYSTCSIGIALCLGFVLPRNFHFPYAAIGFSDFWRRWHISLSTWLRDYLYIPLGGNRKGQVRTQLNLMITMLLGGLWHGASWTFVIWGGLHGLYLIGERLLTKALGHHAVWKIPVIQFLLAIFTFISICFTWVFFRANSLEQATSIVTAMLAVSAKPATLVLEKKAILTATSTIVVIFLIHWRLKELNIEDIIAKLPWWVVSVGLSVMLYAIATLPGEDRSFIYFQF
ncbi:MBOAT family O-acyltransferase [Chamaesiphon sp. OTE_8_metabat_110]|uniref:MBOAT family O-acyltransferase n=1 Tax=Chamaesiphon sp. OTE_8_metabat_110 TaxID=2964696 RepID=UPI002869EEA1|nr:MBOAT family O-acyltransferase [Chamaesiphon sp. OTE_8_metabat_110]